jgi:hypothetical protein
LGKSRQIPLRRKLIRESKKRNASRTLTLPTPGSDIEQTLGVDRLGCQAENNGILRQHNDIPDKRSDFHIWLSTVRIKWLQKTGVTTATVTLQDSGGSEKNACSRLPFAWLQQAAFSRFLAKVAIECTRKDKYETNPQSILMEGQKSPIIDSALRNEKQTRPDQEG